MVVLVGVSLGQDLYSRVMMRRRSALKTRHHYPYTKYTSTIVAALASYSKPSTRPPC